ncbi:hypothetical protein [Leptospira vanthielii]|uniref:Uncharacterized protein n=1 Tax=Leptospira vanthielii serovar Holland str. Waz Holland = ATCC 700522 TaxID=1218591 RepID=N1WI75_9LEPT|nr:hypothetical protein [Leptospira vanthielii]EMY71556.1 hypothetical protein LEP1GSC199_1553 [Leptospira vanthielii serovar Holland str. Waz Holland = ATCC 700522]
MKSRKESKIRNCNLCLEEKLLCESHIIPEFWFQSLYHKHKFIQPKMDQKLGVEIYQKGIKEPMLCTECEGFLNTTYEQPIHQFWKENINIRSLNGSEDPYFVRQNLNYTKFKLYHLSILWRAHHSKNPIFEKVNLGEKHEKILREMILTKNPGKETDYPIFGSVLFRDRTGEVMIDLMINPIRVKTQDGHYAYKFLYGGVSWWIGVSSHIRLESNTDSLTDDGRMILYKSYLEDDPRIAKLIKNWFETFEELPKSLLVEKGV